MSSMLLTAGARAVCMNDDATSPVHVAAEIGSVALMSLLVAHSSPAIVNAQNLADDEWRAQFSRPGDENEMHDTPLLIATKLCYDGEGVTVTSISSDGDHKAVVEYLLNLEGC